MRFLVSCPLNKIALKSPSKILLQDSRQSVNALEAEHALLAIQEHIHRIKEGSRKTALKKKAEANKSKRSCIAFIQFPRSISSILVSMALMRYSDESILPCQLDPFLPEARISFLLENFLQAGFDVLSFAPAKAIALASLQKLAERNDALFFFSDEKIKEIIEKAVLNTRKERRDTRSNASGHLKKALLDAEKTCIAFSSSGSSGKPKWLAHNLLRMRSSSLASNTFFQLDKESISYLCLPLWHAAGFGLWMRSLYASAAVYVDDESSFHPRKTLETLLRLGISHASFVEAQMKRMLSIQGAFTKLKQAKPIKAILIGGAAMSSSIWQLRKQIPLYPVYGMTESFGHIAVAGRKQKEGSYRLLSDDSVCIKEKEICIYKKYLASFMISFRTTEAGDGHEAILKNSGTKQKSRKIGPVFSELDVDDEGFFHTGDLGWKRKNVLYGIRRADNLIISGALKVHAEEIELALNEFSFVKASCVFSLPSVLWGQRPVALLLLEPKAAGQPGEKLKKEIEMALLKKLERFKMPDTYYCLKKAEQDFFSSLNKPLRKKIRALFRKDEAKRSGFLQEIL